MAVRVEELYATKGGGNKDWSDIYTTSNQIFHARFCTGEGMLRSFLFGMLHPSEDSNHQYFFDEARCSNECLEVLRTYGMKTDGCSLFHSLHYEPIAHTFKSGEVIPNFNGEDYRILSVLSPDNLLLMATSDNQLVVGIGVQFFERYPKEYTDFQDNVVRRVEWAHGIYLGSDITKLDFGILKQEYGEPEQIETISDLRDSIESNFNQHKNISVNTSLTERVRKAASDSLYQLYSTDKREEFQVMLDKGMYDGVLTTQTKKAELMR